MSFTWNGRQLEVVKYGDSEVLYTYNREGIRTSKTVNGITTTVPISLMALKSYQKQQVILLYGISMMRMI